MNRRLTCVALVVFGIWLRTLGLSKPPWFDEIQSVLGGSTHLATLLGVDQPPLHFWLNGFFHAGGDPFRSRVVSLVWAALFLAVLWIVSERHFPAGGPVVLWLAATAPFLLRYGVEIRAYGLLILVTTLALAFYQELAADGAHRWCATGLIASLTMAPLTHAVGVLVVPALAGLLWARKERGLALTASFVPVLAFFCWYVAWDMRNRLGSTEWISAMTPLHLTHQLIRLGVGFDDSVVGLLGGPNQMMVASSLIALSLLGLTVLFSGGEGKEFLAAGLIYLGLVVGVSLFKPICLSRTLLPLWPFFLFFVASGVNSLHSRKALIAVVLCAGWFGCFSAHRWIQDFAERPIQDFRPSIKAAREVLDDTSVLVVSPPTRQVARFYFPDRTPLVARGSSELLRESLRGREKAVFFVCGWMQPSEWQKTRAQLRRWGSEQILLERGPANCYLYKAKKK